VECPLKSSKAAPLDACVKVGERSTFISAWRGDTAIVVIVRVVYNNAASSVGKSSTARALADDSDLEVVHRETGFKTGLHS
jgi:hypothetical protein